MCLHAHRRDLCVRAGLVPGGDPGEVGDGNRPLEPDGAAVIEAGQLTCEAIRGDDLEQGVPLVADSESLVEFFHASWLGERFSVEDPGMARVVGSFSLD